MPTSDAPLFLADDVIVVPFPYPDRFAEKRRPAVVVSGSQLAAAGFLWVVIEFALAFFCRAHIPAANPWLTRP